MYSSRSFRDEFEALKRFGEVIDGIIKYGFVPPAGDPLMGGGMPMDGGIPMGGGMPMDMGGGMPMGGVPMDLGALMGGGGMPPPAMPGPEAPITPQDIASVSPDATMGGGAGGETDVIASLRAAVAILKEGIKQLDKAVSQLAAGPVPSGEQATPSPEAKAAQLVIRRALKRVNARNKLRDSLDGL